MGFKQIKKLFTDHYVAIIILIFCLGIILLNLTLTQSIRPFNSDDVSWQTILISWTPFSHQRAFMGSKDNFLINAPFIFIIDSLFGIKRSTIFLTSIIFAIINFVCFFIAFNYFLKKTTAKIKPIYYSPLIWLTSFGFGFSELFLNPNWRSVEIGISFLFFVLASQIYFKEINPLKSKKTIILCLLILSLAALLTYSDNYFLYFTLVPIFLIYFCLFVLKQIDKKSLYLSIFSILYALLVSRVLRSIMARIGLYTPGPLLVIPRITSFKTFSQNLVSSYLSLKYILGTSDIPNTITKWSYSRDVINTILLLLVVVLIIIKLIISRKNVLRKLKKPKINHTNFIVSLLILVSLMDYVAYLLVDKGNTNSYRYLIILVYSLIILMAILLSKAGRWKYILSSLILLATIFNLTNLYSLYNTNISNNPTNANVVNYKLISIIKANRLSIGYANYWNADINTYLSDGKINFLPVACVKGVSKKDYLLVNSNNFNLKADRFFYIVQPSLNSPASCSISEVHHQFGQPVKTIYFSGKYILIYNSDLSQKMT